jgi:hypothetical protein
MAEQQSPMSGEPSQDTKSELTRLGGILVGLALIVGALNNQAVQLSGQALPTVPAPGVLIARIIVGLVGAVLLLWGLVGMLKPAIDRVPVWWKSHHAVEPPERDVGLPPDRNPLFRGRRVELTQLRQWLVQNSRLDLSGLGGVGKTQIAIEYLHAHREDYSDGVFWVRGDTKATLASDLAALAWLPPLSLPERQERAQTRSINAVIAWLRERHHWLLVVDNLDGDAVTALDRLLGRGLQGHLLVTSHVAVRDLLALPIEPMGTEDGRDLVMELTGQPDKQAATTVTTILGGLPLALVQAASYVKTSGRDLGSYAELLRTRLAEMLDDDAPNDYPLTVAAAIRLSVDRIQQYRGATALLHLCAHTYPYSISVRLVAAVARDLPPELRDIAIDEVSLDRAIAELRRHALIDRKHDSLIIHQLVQQVVRRSVGRDEWERWLQVVVRLASKLPPADLRNLPGEVQAALGDELARAALVAPSLPWAPERYPPSALLRPEFAIVPFFGRAEALMDLKTWATSDDEAVPSLAVVASVGVGKKSIGAGGHRKNPAASAISPVGAPDGASWW